ncbi:nucleotidyltransferase/HEPN domain-containing protein [Rickettsia canadensis]|uniref:Nucleotidyltransferase/HEPN domain-containing protein n=1 Tax=Rickettsia canadensis str. CA410 TaxID=1105107 RepID=A0ABN4A8N5_RICCA|nr:nucleotidyltransferase/HEPN domain-containing protein [Rickettsia canadensis]AFB20952.1 nucleotidyltransferase/HEPN domain-containing protein [Rickettsia canadensis str. CA410]
MAGFLIDSKNNLGRARVLRHSTFYLYQAIASVYSTILLVFSNYKLHDIKKLGSRAKDYNSELLQVFPKQSMLEQKECFRLLQKGYVDARYYKHKLLKNNFYI